MTVQWYPFRHPAAFLVLAAVLFYGATSLGGWSHVPVERVAGQPVASATAKTNPVLPIASEDAATPATVCVTRAGFCPVTLARTGDPCGCPHPLRGVVAGHIERVDGTPMLPHSSDWPERHPTDQLYDRNGLVAP